MFVTNNTIGNVSTAAGKITRLTPVRELGVAEETLILGVIDIAHFLIHLPPKDTQCIQFLALASIVEPEDTVRLWEICAHVIADNLVPSGDLRNHIVGNKDDNVPRVANLTHVRVACLDFRLVGAKEDLMPCNWTQDISKFILCRWAKHACIVSVT